VEVALFAAVSKLLAAALLVTAAGQAIRFPARITPAGGSGTLMDVADLSCAGVFLTPELATGAFTSTTVSTLKEHDGTRRVYLAYDGNGHVIEFNEPTLSACNTALGSINTATSPGWGGDWGEFKPQADDPQ
jgi:hypothetical protein